MEEWGAGQSSPRRLRGQLQGQVAGVLEVRGLGPSCSLPLGGGSGGGRGSAWGCRACLSLALTEAAAKEEEAKDNPEKSHGARLSR